MLRDRSSRCVTSVVKKLWFNNPNHRLSSSSEAAVRSNVKLDALSSHNDHNRSNRSLVVSRSRSSVGSSKRKASVLRRQHGLHQHLVLNRNHSRNTNVHRKRRSSNSRSRSGVMPVIPVRAKARSHKL